MTIKKFKVVRCKNADEISKKTVKYSKDGYSCFIDAQSGTAICQKRIDHELYYTVFLVLEDGSGST